MPLDATSVSETILPATLLDLRVRVEEDDELSRGTRTQMRWALNAVDKRAVSLLATTTANGSGVEAVLRHLRVHPQGLSIETIINIGTLLRRTVERYVPPEPEPVPTPPAPEPGPAERLLYSVSCRFAGMALRPFLRWLDDVGLAPADVPVDVLRRYETEGAKARHPRQHIANVRSAWNRHAAGGAADWPPIQLAPLPSCRQRRSAHTADLHPDVLRLVGAHYAERIAAHEGPRRARGHRVPPLKASSAMKSMSNLLLYAGALQELGADVSGFATLAELLHPDVAADALDRIADRSVVETSTQAANVASTILALARHTCALPREELEELASFAAELRPDYRGMVDAKIQMLMPLRDRARRRALFELPYRLAREGDRIGGKRGARLVEAAVGLELLLVSCLRVSNVASLHLSRSFVGTPSGTGARAGRRFLSVPSRLVKNGEPSRIELRPETIALIDHFLRVHRPLLVADPAKDDGYLFPARTRDGNVDVGTLRVRVERVVKDRLGLIITPHLFRSLAVMTYLEYRPGDFLTLMKVLGHRRLETLITHYAFIDQEASAAAVQELILHDRRIHAPLRPGSRIGRGAGAPRRRKCDCAEAVQ